ncbi:ATP-dependent RNA helicase DeaD [Aeromicrobium sp. SORGH_AS981]|uniref:DEAD/DEAH box helicase n=1 Tax=Aeromicrobium sp. SORGH_AS_0981 TaxID=3041802 RepID=UPI0028543F50|nr:DEAD/DEAH box helicase [Aeromicrobium sp. SORGH_AS_0981]MDR6117195.1 ATP-dependent RNA helicase DeaD [Aeromicrobium sp. SORGH_AS_0981]
MTDDRPASDLSDQTPDQEASNAPEATAPGARFAALGLGDELVEVLGRLGYEAPTPIQEAAVPALLAGRDVVGLAQTGTGKTAAFALPILEKIDPDRASTQALVLAPTRELALQVCEAMTSYTPRSRRIRVLPVYGGQGYGAQLAGLERGAHVVVGTPGRVMDHLDRGSLDLSGLDHLVLDEADEMLAMGFAEDVERILADTPEYKQVALFSATMPPAIRRLAKRYLHDPADIATPQARSSTSTVRQRWIPVSHHAKLDALTRLLEVESGDAMIIFVRTKSATEELAERLRSRGFSAAAINGDLVQAQRERTVTALKNGSLDILVATDVAARGLDVDRITHVVNYDIPHDPEAYVHRVGRTGRAGRSGEAILFVTPRERRLLSAIEKVSGRPVEETGVPSVDEVNARRTAKFAQAITDSMGSAQFHAFRGLVEDYVREHDVEMLDVAAALAVMSTDDKEFFLRPDPPKKERRERPERQDRPVRDAGDRPPRPSRDGWAPYRIAVGKRHKVTPSMIVGALANEGGLRRADFGKITLGIDHAVVELPQDLPPAVFEALADTRISGRRIELQADRGARVGRSSRDDRPTAHRKGSGGPGGKGKGGQRGSWSKDGESPRKPRHPKGH